MPLLHLIVVLIVVAIVWYVFSSYVLPLLPEPFRVIIIVLLALAVCIWLLSLIGLIGPLRLG